MESATRSRQRSLAGRLERIRLLFTYITATANCAALPYHYHRATASFLSSFLCPAFDNPAWRHGPVVSRYRARFPLGGFFWLFAYPSSHLLLAAGGRQKEERSYTHCATFLPNLASPQLITRFTTLISANSDCPPCLSGGEGPRQVSSNHMLETTPNPRTSRASLAATTLQSVKVANLHECVAALDPCPRPSSPHHTTYPPDPTSTTLDMTLWNLYNTLHRESGNRPPSFRLPF